MFQDEELEQAVDKDLLDLHSVLPAELQDQLVKNCANMLDTLYTSPPRFWLGPSVGDVGQGLKLCLFLLKKGIKETKVFDIEDAGDE